MCLPTTLETRVQSLGWEDLLEKEMTTHSTILAWKIPWMEVPVRLQSMGSQRIGHDWVTSLHFYEWKKELLKRGKVPKMYIFSERVYVFFILVAFFTHTDTHTHTHIYIHGIVNRCIHRNTYYMHHYCSQSFHGVIYKPPGSVCFLFWHVDLLRFLFGGIMLLLLSRFSHVRLCATP